MAINFFNSLAVGTNVLYVDTLNDRVGIGTSTPDTGTNLHVLTGTGSGQIKLSSQANTQFQFYGDGNQDINYGKPANFPDPGGSVIGQIRYSHGSNYMAFKVNNAEMVRFASNNNVGIGTISPSQKLHVSGNVTANRYYGNGSTVYYVDPNDSTTSAILNGKVGIGTSSPNKDLVINNSSGAQLQLQTNGTDKIRMEADSGGGSFYAPSGAYIRYFTSGSERLRIGSSGQIGIGGANYGTSGQVLTSNGSGSAPSWQDAGTGSSNWTLSGNNIYNNNSGNVGVGTTSPDKTLHIQTNDSAYGSVRIQRDSTTQGETSIGFFGKSNTPNNEAWVIGESGWSNTNDFVIGNENGGAGGNVRMLIQRDGNVGINTTSPGYKLEVNGTAKADEFVSLVNASNSGITRDWTIIGTGDRGAGLQVNDISGAKYAIYAGGYDLTFGKHVSSNNTYTTAMGIYAANATDSSPYVQATHSLRAPIFYDSNDTNYYVNPASTSRIRKTNLIASGSGWDDGLNLYSNDATNKWNLLVDNGSADHLRFAFNSSEKARLQTNGALISYGQFVNSGNGFKSLNNKGMVGDYDTNGTAAKIIWTIGDSWNSLGAMYGLAYEYNGTYGHHLALRENGTTYQRLSFYSGSFFSGTVTSNTDFRAPVFYDSNNTGYYVNPASSSQFADIYYNAWLRNNRTASSSGLYWESGTPGAGWHIYPVNTTDMFIRSGSTSNGSLRLTAGNETARGYLYWDSSSNVGFLSNAAAWTFRVDTGGNTFATTSSRAPIFYDSNDTNYYTDPASRSNLSTLVIGSTAANSSGYKLDIHGAVNAQNNDINYVNQLHFNANVRFYDDNNDSYLNFKYGDSNYGAIVFWNGVGTRKGFLYADSNGFGLLDSDGQWTVRSPQGGSGLELRSNDNVEFTVNDDHTLSHGSSRAPIFYDSNDTGYYLDPASTSIVNTITANDALQAYHIGIRNTSNSTKDGISLYGGATGGEPTYGIMFTGTSGSGTHGAVTGDWATYFTMNNDNSRGWIFRRVGSGNAASISGGGIGTFSNARFTGIVSNGGTTGDATVGRNHAYNTLELKGYGQEMMIGSEGAALHINYRTCNNGVSGHTPTSWYWRAGSSTSYSNHYMGLIQSSSSMRAPIFYDSSNTSYYVDPASVNVLNRVVAGTTSTSNSGSQLYVTGTTSATNPIGYFDNSWGGYGHAAYEFKNIAYGHALQFKKTTPYDGGALKFMYSSTQVGSIQIGNTSTAYLTTSDYRLKENVIELTDGIERVKQLQPKRFNFIDDEDTVDGFVAHEAQEVVPESVTGEKDGVLPNGEPVYQGIDQAKLVPLLTAALKEAITKIEDLETRIQILENQ